MAFQIQFTAGNIVLLVCKFFKILVPLRLLRVHYVHFICTLTGLFLFSILAYFLLF